MKFRFVFLFFIGLTLSSCGDLTQMYIQNNCNTSAAYAHGVNAAKDGRDMDGNYASSCPVNQDEINTAYRMGFKYGLSHMPPPPPAQINVFDGHGHHHHHHAKECLQDNFGHQTCGYGCVKTPFEIQCAQLPHDSCVKDPFNNIQCGRNCRIDAFNNITCDSKE